MADPEPQPSVQHSLDGDAKILSATVGTRTLLRSALTGFLKDVQKHKKTPVQIMADVKIRVDGSDSKEHTYNVTITAHDFDATSFTKRLLQSSSHSQQTTPGASASSSAVPKSTNGLPATSTPRSETRKERDDDDLMEIRPFKRLKSIPTAPSPQQPKTPAEHRSDEPPDYAKLVAFLESWKADWVQQGGWLFDNITKLSSTTQNNKLSIEQKMAAVQDVIGQSINSSNSSTMTELGTISGKLIPWVENCRKVSADKSQAREEKWRTSSATFHDESRRDREAAEKRIEKRLEEQNDLLMKLAKANGLDTDEADGDSTRESREESLGAQLTAELNQEASTARPISRYDADTGTIIIND